MTTTVSIRTLSLKKSIMIISGLVLAILALFTTAPPASAQQYTRTFTVDAIGHLNPWPVVVEVPTMGVVELIACFNSPSHSMWVRLRSFDDAQPFFGVMPYDGHEMLSWSFQR